MTTFQAVAVTILAVLPGASYTFAFERVAGSFGVSLSDRLVRFTAASAAFHALFSGPELLLYRELVLSGRLQRAEIAAWQFELLAVAYVFLPRRRAAWSGMAGTSDGGGSPG